jgi:transposase-like protein
VAQLAREEGISDVTFYTWLKQANSAGAAVLGGQKLTDNWSAEARLAVVIETTALSEIEFSEYCRRKGLYPQQVKAWKSACLTGQQSAKVQSQADPAQTKADRQRIRQRGRGLNRKEKALAEAAALLLVLRKKLNAYWGDDSEDT